MRIWRAIQRWWARQRAEVARERAIQRHRREYGAGCLEFPDVLAHGASRE